MEYNVQKIEIKSAVGSIHTLTSSGIVSLDEILGGIPVGSVYLIEEDVSGVYSKVMLSYFLAEGVANNHHMYVASQECSPESIVKNLPSVTNAQDDEPKKQDEKLVIAWRYQNMDTKNQNPTPKLGHYYDLTKPIDETALKNVKVTYWSAKENYETNVRVFQNPAYENLLNDIKRVISEGEFSYMQNSEKTNILRIAIQSIGSPFWLANNDSYTKNCKDLEIFLYLLRALARSAAVVIAVTLPSNIIDKNTISRCIHYSDTAVKLQSFSGTELEKNACLAEYHGFFLFNKFPSLNCLRNMDPGPIDYAFKLRRKKFCIETLHLPPELQDVSESDAPSPGCGSSSKHLLEF